MKSNIWSRARDKLTIKVLPLWSTNFKKEQNYTLHLYENLQFTLQTLIIVCSIKNLPQRTQKLFAVWECVVYIIDSLLENGTLPLMGVGSVKLTYTSVSSHDGQGSKGTGYKPAAAACLSPH